MRAYIHDLELSCTFNLMVDRSTLSFSVARQVQRDLGIGDACHTNVTIPTNRGPYTTALVFTVIEQQEPSVVLGLDWSAAFLSNVTSSFSQDVVSMDPVGQLVRTNINVVLLHDILQRDINHLNIAFNAPDSPLYVFQSNTVLLHMHMVYHGIQNLPTTVEDCHGKLIHHLLSAACLVPTEKGSRHFACGRFARSFNNPLHMSYEGYNAFLLPGSRLLAHLRIGWKAVGTVANLWRYEYKELLRMLHEQREAIVKTFSKLYSLSNTVHSAYYARKQVLLTVASAHGISTSATLTCPQIRQFLISHLVEGVCLQTELTLPIGCHATQIDLHRIDTEVDDKDATTHPTAPADPMILRVDMFRVLLEVLKSSDLRGLAASMGLAIPYGIEGQTLRSRLAHELLQMEEETPALRLLIKPYHLASVVTEVRQWPRVLSRDDKDTLISNFLNETSSASLAGGVCGVCSEFVGRSSLARVSATELPLHLLSIHGHNYGDDFPSNPSPIRTILDGPLSPYLIDPAAVHNIHTTALDQLTVDVCIPCRGVLSRQQLPACALANGTFIGVVPPELSGLSIVEETMIALCRAKCMIVQLREVDSNRSSPINQKAIKGNVIVYPQDASGVARVLPPSIADITTLICVMFVGSMSPSDETLLKSAPLAVRGDKVFNALVWLKVNNFLYHDIEIDMSVIAEVNRLGGVPFHVERVELSEQLSERVSRYDEPDGEQGAPVSSSDAMPFESVFISGVDPSSPPNILRAAALKHLTEANGSFIHIPYDPTPVNSFDNPSMFPMMFPSLFPYGVGGFEDKARSTSLSMKTHVKHLLNLHDRRFQQHHGFMFSAFNILQRRESLLRTSLRTKQLSFQNIAAQLTSISSTCVHDVYVRLRDGHTFVPANDQESRVFKLMQEVNVINKGVPGSPSSKVVMRNEIRALMLEKGMPSFFITLNPADVYNPIVKFLSGSDINIDDMKASEVPTYWTQALLIAKNPCIGARFFNIYMNAFIRCLLGYRSDGYDQHSVGGILGFTSAYYGCVEAQGRGTLHCHMLVWLDGALNPDQLKQKVLSDGDFATTLLRYLEDNIHNCTPVAPLVEVTSDTLHASSLRSVYPQYSACGQTRLKDFHNVVKACQYHKHSHTCFKYCHGAVRECRFALGVERERAESSIDNEGVINLRCAEGLVNDYNPTMLEAVRCNMDIKFIGSGVSAKAALYYITDYITKPGEKSYVSYAALEMAVRRSEEVNADVNTEEASVAVRSKKLLQKCASAMISRQELSAPFVATYLLGIEDHYTSHTFGNIYWTSFEQFVDNSLATLSTVIQVDSMDHGITTETPDLAFDVGDDGVLTPLAPQVEDYVYRSPTLEKLSVWDVTAQLSKNRTKEPFPIKVHPFIMGHRDRQTHAFHVLPCVRVPVPIGPGLPRRNLIRTAERHAKIMLLLFKPWRNVTDLKKESESWIESYTEFLLQASPHARFVMDNMQLLHECRDSRDDHFDTLRKNRRDLFRTITRDRSSLADEETLDDMFDEAETLDNPEDMECVQTDVCATSKLNITDSILSAVASGLPGQLRIPSTDPDLLPDSKNIVDLDDIHQSDKSQEGVWKRIYKDGGITLIDKEGGSAEPIPLPQASIDSGANVSTRVDLPSIVSSGRHLPELSGAEMVASVEAQYTLNKEQQRAFRIISNHSLQTQQSPLKMYLMGHGGTGKSRVIHALTDFFARRGQSHRFMIGAFTGVAAMHVGGNTLHSLLGLGSESKKGDGKANAKSRQNLITKWEGVDYLLIDEISMVGCALLHDISEAMMLAKGSNLVFGGLSVIFCGDFAQLPPVKQKALYTQINMRAERSYKKSASSSGIKDVALLGRNLWLEVDCVVELTEVMRQSGPENNYFISLLNRVRDGSCTDEDYQRLNSRLITTVNPDWSSDQWSNVPVIVYSNALKDALNIALTASFATKHHKPFQWYHSDDYHLGESIDDPKLREGLSRVDSGRSQQRMGRLPLVEGMPVMITHNYAVESGVANGTIGVLRGIRYEINQFGERIAISCTVSLPGTNIQFPGLQPTEVPVLQDDSYITLTHRRTKQKCTIKRRQVCLMPGFAFTAHKAEGMTLPNVIVDIHSCVGIESVYVMLSRVKSIEGLLLLRPFDKKKIRCRPSQDRRVEAERLRILRYKTICKYGDSSEIKEAKAALRKLSAGLAVGLNKFGKRQRE